MVTAHQTFPDVILEFKNFEVKKFNFISSVDIWYLTDFIYMYIKLFNP